MTQLGGPWGKLKNGATMHSGFLYMDKRSKINISKTKKASFFKIGQPIAWALSILELKACIYILTTVVKVAIWSLAYRFVLRIFEIKYENSFILKYKYKKFYTKYSRIQ